MLFLLVVGSVGVGFDRGCRCFSVGVCWLWVYVRDVVVVSVSAVGLLRNCHLPLTQVRETSALKIC